MGDYLESEFDPPEPKDSPGSGQNFWKFYLTSQKQSGKLMFLQPHAVGTVIPEVRYHYLNEYLYCLPCTTVWNGESCAFVQAKIRELVFGGMDQRLAWRSAKASTAYVFPVSATLISGAEERWCGSRVILANHTDGGKGGTIRALWKACREKCMCNLGEITHGHWECPTCSKPIVWMSDDQKKHILPRCPNCRDPVEPREVVSCSSSACARPKRASLYDCLWTMTKKDRGHNFDRGPFGQIPDKYLQPEIPWRNRIEWASAERLIAAGLGNNSATSDPVNDNEIPF